LRKAAGEEEKDRKGRNVRRSNGERNKLGMFLGAELSRFQHKLRRTFMRPKMGPITSVTSSG
jgi:hypothetical protein